METWRTGALIGLAGDPSARQDERDDAVADRCGGDGPRVRAVLPRPAGDPDTEYVVAGSAGESLGGIAARTTPPDAAGIGLRRSDARAGHGAAYRHSLRSRQDDSGP